MTTHALYDLPRDAQIMRKLVANSEGNLGDYASFVQAGKVTAGDSLSVV